MNIISSKEAQNNFGSLITQSYKEPIVIEKYGKPAAVMISHETFLKYQEFEDLYWSLKAQDAESGGYLSPGIYECIR